MIRSVGILGLGSFGQFAASLAPKGVEVVGFDHKQVKSPVKQVALVDVVKTDMVILAIPLSAYQAVLDQIKPLIKPNTLLVDICSVKLLPTKLLTEHLPDHPNLLVTHPLFGPETASLGRTKGRDLIVTESRGHKAQQVLAFCKADLELSIHYMTPETHDQTMAQVHALTFFVARGLANTPMKKVPFQTPSFQMVLDLIELDSKHSDELFQTIQLGNPYAASVRNQVTKSFETLAADLEKA